MEKRQIADNWNRGDPYERYIGRWSRQIAPRFLSWMDCRPGLRWLDVGCGTGALSTSILDGCAPALVVGVEPSPGFLAVAREKLTGRMVFSQGKAAAIPLKPAAVNVVVSGLVLNFVGDPLAALREMARVAGSGGIIGAYLWDYAEKMELLRLFWDVAIELDPGAAALDEGSRFPLCRPDGLREAFASAGLRSIEITSIDLPTRFTSFDDYWQPFLGGQGSAPSYVMTLDSNAKDRLRDQLRKRLPIAADGTINMIARAWAARALVAN